MGQALDHHLDGLARHLVSVSEESFGSWLLIQYLSNTINTHKCWDGPPASLSQLFRGQCVQKLKFKNNFPKRKKLLLRLFFRCSPASSSQPFRGASLPALPLIWKFWLNLKMSILIEFVVQIQAHPCQTHPKSRTQFPYSHFPLKLKGRYDVENILLIFANTQECTTVVINVFIIQPKPAE